MSHVDVDIPDTYALALSGYGTCDYCGVGSHSTWQHEVDLGQAVQSARAQIVEAGIVVLAKTLEKAKEIAKRERFLHREWADRFEANTQSMVVRELTVGKDGVYRWEKNPQLLTIIADFVDSEQRDHEGLKELTTIAHAIRQTRDAIIALASAATAEAAAAAVKVAAAALKSAKENFPPVTEGGGVLIAAGVLVALIGVAYVWRAFK